MFYFEKLNNAELFATYAQEKPNSWSKVTGRAVTHAIHGNGIILDKTGVIIRVEFQDGIRFFCELEFLGSRIPKVEFTDLDLPPDRSRGYLIEILYSWENFQKRASERSQKQWERSYRRTHNQQSPPKSPTPDIFVSHFRQKINPALLNRQKGLAKIESDKYQREEHRKNYPDESRKREEGIPRRVRPWL